MKKYSENSEKHLRSTFRKEERLCSKKVFDKLFSEGNSFFIYPVKIVYAEIDFEGEYPAKAAFAVSKKLFKRAVKRNLLKRRMREAYRCNKYRLSEEKGNKKVALVFIYVGKQVIEYHPIEKAIKRAIDRIASAILD